MIIGVSVYIEYNSEEDNWNSWNTKWKNFATLSETLRHIKRNYPGAKKIKKPSDFHYCYDDDSVFYECGSPSKDLEPEMGKRVKGRSILHVSHEVYEEYKEYVLDLNDKSIQFLKEGCRVLRLAEIYAQRIDWMMSGDDGEDTMLERFKEIWRSLNKNTLRSIGQSYEMSKGHLMQYISGVYKFQ